MPLWIEIHLSNIRASHTAIIANITDPERNSALQVLTRLAINANTATFRPDQRGLWMAMVSGAIVQIVTEAGEHQRRNQRHLAQPIELETAGGTAQISVVGRISMLAWK